MINKDFRWKVEYIENGKERIEEGRETLSHTLHLSKSFNNAVIKSVEGYLDLDISKDDMFFLNGYQTWTYSKEQDYRGKERGLKGTPKVIVDHYSIPLYGDYSFVEYSGKNGEMHGYTYMTIRNGDNVTLLSSLDECYGWTMFFLDTNKGILKIKKDVENLEYSGEFHLFDLYIKEGNEEEVFASWFSEMNMEIKAKPLAGYSSWYNRYQDISEGSIKDDLKGCQRILEKGDLFQIDDGWEIAVGDWQIDENKFPNGLKTLVDEIHKKGYIAGLWLAPFVCEEKSRIFKEHKDWLLDIDGEKFKCGSNWSGFWALDIDNKEFQEYLSDVFDTVYNKWGFDLVKLDFLYAAAPKAKKNETRSQRMIMGMDYLRSLSKNKLILGCGVPLGAAFGRTEYCRVSCDVTLDWDDKVWMKLIHSERPSTKRALETSYYRRMLNKGAFITDPDVFFLRRDNIHLSKERKMMLATFDALNKGLFLTSDNPSLYGDEEIEEYKKLRHIWKDGKILRVERGEKTIIHYSIDNKEETLTLHF
ncbi:MAG: alpha-galactosidase [Spirochaetales bacterium]|nr:alpha-galactosidase [Spirochaetales bacterium]